MFKTEKNKRYSLSTYHLVYNKHAHGKYTITSELRHFQRQELLFPRAVLFQPASNESCETEVDLGISNLYQAPDGITEAHTLTHQPCEFVPCPSSRVRYGLTSHQTHYKSYRGQFLRVRWPNQHWKQQSNSVKALKDNSWSVHQVKGQSHQAKPSIQGKVKYRKYIV